MTDTKHNSQLDPVVRHQVRSSDDPSINVTAVIFAESRRQDDLRAAAELLSTVRHEHSSEIGKLREEYQEKIQLAANTAITTLASQTTELQRTLATQVTDTAAAQETRYGTQYGDTNKRLSALELSSSQEKGKQGVSDPAIAEMASAMIALRLEQTSSAARATTTNQTIADIAEKLDKLVDVVAKNITAQALGTGHRKGESEGMAKFYGWIVGAAALIVALLTYLK